MSPNTSSSQHKEFEYSSFKDPAREIRLISIHAVEDSERASSSQIAVSCSLTTVEFESPSLPQYIAISYAWGNTSRTKSLVINGKLTQITENLDHALRYFRASSELRGVFLWIDAICIDQQNNEEKSIQVSMMKRIFESAHGVVAWLGPSDEGDKIAIEALYELESVVPATETSSNISLKNVYDYIDVLRQDNGPKARAIQKLTTKPWFIRCWIPQEFLVAKTVRFMCGSSLIHWSVFYLATVSIRSILRPRALKLAAQASSLEEAEVELMGLDPGNHLSGLFRMRELFQQDPNTYSLWDLLLISKGDDLEASDPRDTVFALLGVANDQSHLRLEVDYDTTTKTCFVNTSKALLHQGHLRLLWLASEGPNTPARPSWVVDWSVPMTLQWYLGSFCRDDLKKDLPGTNDNVFSASANSTAELSFHRDGSQEVLSIHGTYYDKITGVTDRLIDVDDFDGDYPALNYLRETVDQVKKMATKLAVQPFPDASAIVKTLFGDIEYRYEGGGPIVLQTGVGVVRRLSSEVLDVFTHFVSTSALPPGWESLHGLLRARLIYLRDRRIFVTSKGNLGIGSEFVEPGDVVAVFHGAEAPFVLRKAETCHMRYRCICPAYVDGIMDGEALLAEDKTRDFQLI
ncbi:hypothetical protein H2200_012327 [Cladophialophora chaetospira]|uniref:Heterokaryon incompatibility domain-containing protein n=1 Tax=Cladophialophora chaetospira TaxID=386627 RepID=A0AA38WXR3_9EURO|nr:hypothetical protein H2200_012327 [Cladophialophora chaetospira]